MSSIRIELHPSYILHTRPYRDTSLLVDVLTQEYGKISLVAKGARKAKNNQRYLLQPFIPVLLSWQGKSSLKTLIGIELNSQVDHVKEIATVTTESHSGLNSGLNSKPQSSILQGSKLYSALYANELLAYLLYQDDPNDTLYLHYQRLLKQLSNQSLDVEPCLRDFEFTLLDDLGYGINFYSDADTGEDIRADRQYFFIQNHGFVLAEHHGDVAGISFGGSELLNIQQRHFDDVLTRRTAKALSRMALQPHLKGRALKSRELFSRID
jgi:DNA repair protein RecO (recombination protein O)